MVPPDDDDSRAKPTRDLMRVPGARIPRPGHDERPTVVVPPLQVPSPGRIVMFHFTALDKTIRSRPAMITSTHPQSPELVNLHVFFESGDGIAGPEVRNARIHDEGPYMPGSWSWPERRP